MQTFLPYADYMKSAKALYFKHPMNHLGKQRVETYQIMQALLLNNGWIHHSAVRMWRGYERSLLEYQQAICLVWQQKGYSDTCWRKTRRLYLEHRGRNEKNVYPHWFGDRAFHTAHQSNLIRKFPQHYSAIFPRVPDDLPYIWPV